MWQYLIKQSGSALLTLWVVMSVTFVLIRALPGGPFQDPKVPPAIQQQLETRFGLDKPVFEQYLRYLDGLLVGDLGPSLTAESRSVTDIVEGAFWVSFSIGFPALILGCLAGIVLGALAGSLTPVKYPRQLAPPNHWQGSFWNTLGGTLATLSLSTPSFIFAGLLVIVFSIQLNWFPTALLLTPRHMVLPVLALSLVPFGFSFFLIRNTVRENLHQGFILIKRTAGLSESQIRYKHLLRVSCLPLLAIMGPLAASLLTGSFAIETMFALPGLGKYFVTAVNNRDYTVVMGITLVFSVLLISLNTFSDVVAGWLDPRLREPDHA